MGNLSNLYISQSYTSLVHLGTDGPISAQSPSTFVQLQDGLGNSLGVLVNANGDVSASGNIYGANITGSQIDTASLVSTSSFNAYSQSVSSSLTNLSASLTVTDKFLQAQITALDVSGAAVSLAYFNQFTASQYDINAGYNTFTSSANVRLNNLESTTASLNSSVTQLNASSASQQVSINNLNTTTASLNTSVSNINSFTSSANSRLNSLESKTGSYATTGSNTFTGIQVINAAISASAARIANLNYPTADGTFSGQVLQTDAAGTLSFGNVATIYQPVKNGEATSLTVGTAVYVSGSQGSNPIVYRADSTNPAKMPVSFIITETITAGAIGRGLVLGVLEGYNVGSAAAGTTFYVDGNGTLTTTRPTGSADTVQPIAIVTKTGSGGQLSVLNPGPVLLPNIQKGYLWVGNGNNQPLAVATSSLVPNINTGSFATTGSNTFTGQQVIANDNPLYILGQNPFFGLQANLDGSGSQYPFGTITLDTNAYSGSGGSIGAWTVQDPSTNNSIGFGINTYSNVYAYLAPVPMIYGQGALTGGDDTLIGFPAGRVDIWRNTNVSGSLKVTGSLNVSSTLTASLQQGYVWVGDNTGKTRTVATSSFGSVINTGSFATTGSNTFTGDQILDGVPLYVNNNGIQIAANQYGSGSQYGSVTIMADTLNNPNDIYESFQVLIPETGEGIIQVAANSYTPESGYGNGTVGWIGGGGQNQAGSTTAIILPMTSADMRVYKPTSFAYDVNITGSLTASLQQGYVWVGASNGKTTTVATSSFGGSSIPAGTVSSSAQILNYNIFATTGSNQFNGNQTITGSTIVSGSFQTSQDITIWDSTGNPTLKIGRGVGNQPSNLAFGVQALGSGAGLNNIAIGNSAMHYASQSNASENVAIGGEALQYNQTDQQIAIGRGALRYTTTGNGNLAIGSYALESNTTGTQNVAIGVGALNKNISGSRNIAIGPDAGFNTTDGIRNTLIGNGAGSGLTGSYNTIIGGYTATGENLSSNIILADGSGNKRLQYSGSTWTTENNFVVSGSLAASNEIKMGRGTNKPTDKVTVGGSGLTVNNSLVTANSYIFATADTTVGNYSPVVSNITNGSFTLSNGGYSGNISVMYMIVNPY